MQFTEVYLGQVVEADFRRNARSTEKGTRTATLHAEGIAKLRTSWIYKTESIAQAKRRVAKERRDAERAAKKAAKVKKT